MRGRAQGHARGRSRQRLLVVCQESNKHFYDLSGMIFIILLQCIHFDQSSQRHYGDIFHPIKYIYSEPGSTEKLN